MINSEKCYNWVCLMCAQLQEFKSRDKKKFLLGRLFKHWSVVQWFRFWGQILTCKNRLWIKKTTVQSDNLCHFHINYLFIIYWWLMCVLFLILIYLLFCFGTRWATGGRNTFTWGAEVPLWSTVTTMAWCVYIQKYHKIFEMSYLPVAFFLFTVG